MVSMRGVGRGRLGFSGLDDADRKTNCRNGGDAKSNTRAMHDDPLPVMVRDARFRRTPPTALNLIAVRHSVKKTPASVPGEIVVRWGLGRYY
jgi:hypothetical protein